MQDDKVQKLEALRSQILDELMPLVEEATVDPAQKFDLLLTIARSSGEPERFEQALNVARSFESVDDKASALFDLLDAMETVTAAPVDETPTDQPDETTQES